MSLVDFNRSGAPLMEIVTEPDVRTAEQARRYAEELQALLRAIGAATPTWSAARCGSRRTSRSGRAGTEPFGTRVEVKNMNSFRSVERAIAFEIERQAAALDAGETLTQDTRGWDEDRGETYVMRSKEDSHDYRYFPEPDLPPLRVDAAWLASIRAALPELPAARRARYERDLGLSAYDAAVIVGRARRERAVRGDARGRPRAGPEGRRELGDRRVPRPAEDGSGGRGARRSRRARRPRRRGSPRGELSRDERQGGLRGARCGRRERSRRSSSRAGFRQISDVGALGAIVDEVIAANPGAVEDYRAGKPVLGFFVGQVMKATRGQANAALVQEAVRARLEQDGRLMGILNIVLWLAGWSSSRSATAAPAGRGPATRRSKSRTPTPSATTRGGAASATTRTTGASVAMVPLRRQAQQWGVVAIAAWC